MSNRFYAGQTDYIVQLNLMDDENSIGTGDVIGPAGAVADRVVLFNGTTGKLIKDSGLTLSGSNTGDQTTITGNAGSATKLATSRTINGVSFDGTGNITVTVTSAQIATALGYTAFDPATKWSTTASTTASAFLKITHGVAPTSPVDGDVWTTTAGMFVRINGSTVSLGASFAGGTLTSKLTTIASATGGAPLNIPQGTAPTTPNNGDIWTTSVSVFARINGATLDLNAAGGFTGGTLTSKLNTVASATGGAGLNVPPGVAPTTPTNGDLWTTASGLFARINGATVGPYGTGGGGGSGDVVGPAGATDGNPVFFDTATGKLIKDSGTVGITKGGTGQTTASAALTALGGTTAAAAQTQVDTAFNNVGLGGANRDITSTDLNTRYLNGFYEGATLTNSPSADNGNFIIQVFQNDVDTLNVVQTATAVGPTRQYFAPGTIFQRTRTAGTWGEWHGVLGANPRGVSIIQPVANDQFTLFYTGAEVLIRQIHAVCRGISPSVTWSIFHDPSRAAAGTALITAGVTTTTTTTAQATNTFDNPTIAANKWVWIKITAVSGTVDEFALSIISV